MLDNEMVKYIEAFAQALNERTDDHVDRFGSEPNYDTRKLIKREIATSLAGKYPKAYAAHQSYIQVRGEWYVQGNLGQPPRESLTTQQLYGAQINDKVQGIVTAHSVRRRRGMPQPAVVEKEVPVVKEEKPASEAGQGTWLSPLTRYRRLFEKFGYAPSDHIVAVLFSIRADDIPSLRKQLAKEWEFEKVVLPVAPGMNEVVSNGWKGKRRPEDAQEKLSRLIRKMKEEDLKAFMELLEGIGKGS